MNPPPGARKVRARAPLRISFAGGGTDVMPYPQTHGGCVLSATIDMYAFAYVEPTSDGSVIVQTDSGVHAATSIDGLDFDARLDMVRAALSRAVPETGVRLTLSSDAPPGSGLGSSSAQVVAMMAAARALEHRPWSGYDLAHEAYKVERYDLDQAGGMQDQYAAAFGGFNFIEFRGEDQVIVHPIKLGSRTTNELHASMLLCHTGMSRQSGGILDGQVKNYLAQASTTMDALAEIKALASEMREALLLADIDRFIRGIDRGWHLKKDLTDGITNERLDTVYDAGRRAGARAGKVLGAGGGGFMLFFCDPEKRAAVAAAIAEVGCTVSRFGFTDHGVSVWEWP